MNPLNLTTNKQVYVPLDRFGNALQQIRQIYCVIEDPLFSHANKVVQYLFPDWLPRSRYQPANLPGMEIYRRQPAEMGWEEYDIDCAVPVVPL